MRDINGGDPQALLHVADLQAHLDPQLGVEIRQRLIEEQHLGAYHHGAGQGDTLLLAAGELGGCPFGHRRQIHRGQGHLDGLVHLRRRHLLQLESVGNIVSH